MRRIFLAGCIVALLSGCGDKAKDMYETAEFEEKQFIWGLRDAVD